MVYKNRLKDQSGLTLIELLLAIGIMGVVSTALYQLLMAHQASYRFQQSLADRQQNGRIGLSFLVREFKWIGYGLVEMDSSGRADPQSCHSWTSLEPFELVENQGIRYLSNLHGVQTVLAYETGPGDTELSVPTDSDIQENSLAVSRGQQFQRNDTLYIYHLSAPDDHTHPPTALYRECHRLASRGSSGRIRVALGDPIRGSFPAGSPVQVVNEIAYFLDPDKKRLMRRLDGGTDALLEGVENIRFGNLNGQITIQLILQDPGNRTDYLRTVETAVALRNQ